MRFSTLDEWLDWQLTLNPAEIMLGLERVGSVWQKVHPDPFSPVVITVAGTNGKGSSVAYLREILTSAGYRVGCYTSPHLNRYNERIVINGKEASDSAICGAFDIIDQQRGDTPLTYFEFGTLAALLLISKAHIDVAILEVGLGGRLDAVNIVDADVALITTVDLDHMDWLGPDREAIGYEKAGIMRSGKPVVFATEDAPKSVVRYADEIGAELLLAGESFSYKRTEQGWDWWSVTGKRHSLPMPSLRGRFQLNNASAVLMALEQLKEQLPVDQQSVRVGLLSAKVPGRFEVVGKEPVVVLDVAHNPEAARALRSNLQDMFCAGETVAVFSMLSDKDISQVVDILKDTIDRWCLYALEGSRAATLDELKHSLLKTGVDAERILVFSSGTEAFQEAKKQAGHEGRVVAFGSFYLVGEMMELV